MYVICPICSTKEINEIETGFYICLNCEHVFFEEESEYARRIYGKF